MKAYLARRESVAAKTVSRCLERGLMIGRTNRSFATLNNTLCLRPVFVVQQMEVDGIIDLLDKALALVA